MSDTAKDKAAAELFDTAVAQLTDIIKNGDICVDQEGNTVMDGDGRPLRRKAPAAYFAVARGICKDLNIGKIPVDSKDPLAEMVKELRLSPVPPMDDSDLVDEAVA